MHFWANSDNEFAIKNDLKIFKELSKAKFCTQRYVFDVVVVLNHRVQYSSKHIKNQLGPPWDTKSARVSQKWSLFQAVSRRVFISVPNHFKNFLIRKKSDWRKTNLNWTKSKQLEFRMYVQDKISFFVKCPTGKSSPMTHRHSQAIEVICKRG